MAQLSEDIRLEAAAEGQQHLQTTIPEKAFKKYLLTDVIGARQTEILARTSCREPPEYCQRCFYFQSSESIQLQTSC